MSSKQTIVSRKNKLMKKNLNSYLNVDNSMKSNLVSAGKHKPIGIRPRQNNVKLNAQKAPLVIFCQFACSKINRPV